MNFDNEYDTRIRANSNKLAFKCDHTIKRAIKFESHSSQLCSSFGRTFASSTID